MTIVKPDIPGTVIRFVGSAAPRIMPSAGDVVALPIIADWGPLGADAKGTDGKQGGPQFLGSFQDYTTLFGDSDTPGRTAVAGCFAGQGLAGAPGAGGVFVYRMGGTGIAAATIVINQTGATPGLTLTAKYKGTRGNLLSYIIDTDPNNPTVNDRLRILYNGGVQETYLYAWTDVIGLVAQITIRSKLVNAVNTESTPTRLIASAGTSLAGGNDGSTLASTDHMAALAALAYLPFGILAPYDLTSAPILASYVSWVQGQDAANRPCRLVVGGAAGETIATALTRSAACADQHVINFGGGTWHDDLLNKDLSTSQLAPRLAGILAAAGQQTSATFSKIAGLHNVGGTMPSPSDIQAAVTGGVVCLMPSGSPDADVRVAKGVTTFTSTTDASRPRQVYGDARLVGVMDNYVRLMKMWGDDNIIGGPVNEDSRATVRGKARQLEDDLLRQGLILPGDDVLIPKPWVVVINTDADPTLSDAIPYQFGWQFAQTANAILGEGQIR